MKPSGARGVTAIPRALIAVTALWCLSGVSCAARSMKLPTGAGMPAPDAADALAQATAVCRGIRSMTAEIALSGSAGGRRIRGRLLAGVAVPASVRLEALAPFGPPLFFFVATNDDATLLLPRDDRVVEHGRPDAVLDAVAGVPLTAEDLHQTLTGCAPTGSQQLGSSFGPDWRVSTSSAGQISYTLYLHRDAPAQPWQLVAFVRTGATNLKWRAEYRNYQNGLPRSIHLASGDLDFDLTLALSQVETNVPLGGDAFRLEIPPSAESITVDELRRARLGIREN